MLCNLRSPKIPEKKEKKVGGVSLREKDPGGRLYVGRGQEGETNPSIGYAKRGGFKREGKNFARGCGSYGG